MPGLSFTLPHWLYWVGLIVFPIIAMVLSRRPQPAEKRYTLPLAYMIAVKRTSLLFGILYGAMLFGEAHLGRHLLAGTLMVAGVAAIAL